MRSRVLAALLGVAIFAAAPLPAAAQDRAAARRLFLQGDRAFAAGQFASALEAYTAAYDAAPLPGFLFNIGQCHRKLGHWAEARDFFQRYIDEVPQAFNRADAERLLEEARVHAPAEPPRTPAASPAAPAPVPRVEPDESSSSLAPRAPAQARSSRSVGAATWLSLGAGAALAGGAVFFALDLQSAQSDIDDPGLDCSSELSRCRELRDRGEGAALYRTVLAGASAAALVLGAVLLTIDLTSSPAEEPSGDVRLSFGPSGASAEVAF